jgi:hypothetical protein
VVPRMLQRWMDVNPQNGALQRTRQYITLPTFSLDIEAYRFNTLVAEYLFAAPHNFSLKSSTEFPEYPEFTLCVSSIHNGVVKRYKLFAAFHESLSFDIPLYNGEMIQKNFKLEIWSAQAFTIVSEAAIVLYTSVLNNVDYRYGSDGSLAGDNGQCLDLGADSDGAGNFALPLEMSACTYNYGDQDGIVLLGNQIQQVISNENGTPISI